jgi:hypothetical protein
MTIATRGLTFPRTSVQRRPQIPPSSLRESEFLEDVLRVARLYGWECHHEHDSRKSSPGWPDLELVRPPRHIRAELKVRERDRQLRGDQKRIMGLLAQVPGLETYCWLPSDLPRIVWILSHHTGPLRFSR